MLIDRKEQGNSARTVLIVSIVIKYLVLIQKVGPSRLKVVECFVFKRDFS